MNILLTAILLITTMLPLHAAGASEADYRVVPLPQSIALQGGEPFVLTSNTPIVYDSGNAALGRDAAFLADYISESTGLRLSVGTRPVAGCLRLELSAKVKGNESYTITVGRRGAKIAASTPQGIFYGIQTLRKSIPVGKADTVRLPQVRISDTPRFGYRGMMLDCSRHFFSVAFIKKFIDILALHNMNVMHWHLTDDQGWRIEIKRYPRLTEIGSVRSGTVIGYNAMADDSTAYGGYYTQDEAREIVAYARDRFIAIVPEIDMPGHMKAALAAYPELGCTGGPYEVGHRWGIYLDVLCLGNESTCTFCENVLEEIAGIFPSELIHIGGDEAPTERWADCTKCRNTASQHSLAAKTLQTYFTNRIERFVNSLGRRIVGWDEILEGDINPSATVMSWRGVDKGTVASRRGHDVIMSPTEYCYFDYCQTDTDRLFEPSPRVDGYLPVEKVYSFDPCPDSLDTKSKTHILGAQGNVWTEYISCPGVAEYYALPRMAALAEVQWCSSRKDFAAFRQRLDALTAFYRLYSLNYARHLWPEQVVKPWIDN